MGILFDYYASRNTKIGDSKTISMLESQWLNDKDIEDFKKVLLLPTNEGLKFLLKDYDLNEKSPIKADFEVNFDVEFKIAGGQLLFLNSKNSNWCPDDWENEDKKYLERLKKLIRGAGGISDPEG
jgi:hypothetical protein